MTATTPGRSTPRPAAIREIDNRIVALVAMMGEAFAPRAVDHERDENVVAENVRALQASDSARLTMRVDLDGLGTLLRQVCHIQTALARSSASTAQTSATSRFITLVTVNPQRRVADVGMILTSRGGADGSWRTEPPRYRPHALE
jgi:hypothetical protein